jgi:hypothetical protein
VTHDDTTSDAVNRDRRLTRLALVLVVVLAMLIYIGWRVIVRPAWEVVAAAADAINERQVIADIDFLSDSSPGVPEPLRPAVLLLVKDPRIATAVVNDPQVAALPFIREKSDAAEWLQSNISAEFLGELGYELLLTLKVPADDTDPAILVLERFLAEYAPALENSISGVEVSFVNNPRVVDPLRFQ